MTDRGIASLLKYLRHAVPPGPDLVADGELLSRYVASRDEAAFELLVRRHGPMVLGTARRVLRDGHAAEDVFQAAFLALARKARSLRRSEAVAGWLHRVTLRAALRARPKPFPLNLAPPSLSETPSALELTELRAALDEEVARLPNRYRQAVVLCYLAGRTTEDVARQLGCPRGTILSRLAAARDRLRVGLTRRGYGLPAAGVVTLWAAEAAPAVSPALIFLAVRAAGPAALIAPSVLTLTEGVLHAMMMTKLKIAAASLLAAGMIGVGVGTLGAGPPTQSPLVQSAPQSKPKIDESAPPSDDQAAKKAVSELIQKLEIASQQRIKLRMSVENGQDDIDEIRRRRAPIIKQMEIAAERLLWAEVELEKTQRHGAPADQKALRDQILKTQQSAIEEATNDINSLRRRDRDFREELMTVRMRFIEAEEALKLHEQISALEIAALRRGIPH